MTVLRECVPGRRVSIYGRAGEAHLAERRHDDEPAILFLRLPGQVERIFGLSPRDADLVRAAMRLDP